MCEYFVLILLLLICAPEENAADILKPLDNSYGINNLAEFLDKSLNTTVLAYNIAPLSTSVGHYASILYTVEVKETGLNHLDECKIHDFVIKTTLANPVSRNRLCHFKESRFYTEVIPALRFFEKSKKIPHNEQLDVFLRFFGTRISLDPNATMVDSDYILMLENVKIQDYQNVDDCFDRDDTFVILKELAKMHATFIAMRRMQPDLFKSRVMPYLMNSMHREFPQELREPIFNGWQMGQNIPKETHLRVEKYLRSSAQYLNQNYSLVESPYTTLCHKDVKTANFMLKKGATTKDETKMKIIDFQQMFHDSFVADLIPFFYLSVCKPEVDAHFKEFVNYYHSIFLRTIKMFECPSEDYTLEKIWSEVRQNAKNHIFFLFKRIRGRILRKTKLDPDATLKTIVNGWESLIKSFDKFGLL